jgi:hypothetical protein
MEPLAFGWGSKTKNWQTEANTWHDFGGKINWLKDLKEELMFWRSKMQVQVQSSVELKDPICFKWVQIDSQEFGHYIPSKVGLN